MKAYINDLGGKQRIPIQQFKGINTGISPLLIDDGQAEDMKNLDTRDFPLLKTRENRDEIISLTGTIHYFGTIDDAYLAVAYTHNNNTVWTHYKNSAWTTGQEVEAANGESVIFRGKNIYVNGSTDGGYCYDGTTYSRLGNMPVVHYIIAKTSRLYAIDKTKSLVYYSGPGDSGANEWTESIDGGAIELISPNNEKCSGITVFNDNVVIFKPHSMYELYGENSDYYKTVNITHSIGCISHRSIKEVSKSLYWLGDSIYVYNGGSKPTDIGLPVKKYLDNKGDLTKACAGTDGERYYLSLPQSDNTRALLVYDTRTSVWTVEEDSGFLQFATLQNELYGITAAGKIYKMVSTATETFNWYWCSKYFSSGMPSMKQNWYSIYITLEIGDDATFKAEVINNKGQIAEAVTTISDTIGNGYLKILRVMIPAAMGHNSDWMQIKLSGTGYCKVHNIERELRTRKGSY